MQYFKDEEHEYVLCFDIEFDKKKLVQFAGILFKKINKSIYQPYRSLNCYVQTTVSFPFTAYTGITNQFLQECGVPLESVVQQVEDDLLKDIDLDKILIVSHGVHNDSLILIQNYINLNYNKLSIKPIDHYCTFENARKILLRKTDLKLEDIAEECCLHAVSEHDAFNDA